MSQPTKILLAEDNPADALLVRVALEQSDSFHFELHHVERLDEALDRLAAEPFDVLLLDLGLPDSQGLATLSKVRGRSNQIPVVVLTGFADEATGLAALSAGAQDYLVKGHAEGRHLVRAIRYAVERHQLLAREQAARERAEAASRAKDQFIAIVSHELRTPLTPVMLLTSALCQKSDLPPDVLNDLETIRHQVEMEVRLISDLLDLTGIQTGKLGLQRQRIDLHDLIRDVVQTFDADAKTNDVRIALHLDADNAQMDADPTRLTQVFCNVLGNAMKFTAPSGNIVIRTQITDDGHLRVGVIDDGVGIDQEFMRRIFGTFEQGEQQLTRRFGGLGVGLAISKAIVELHHGKIDASSEGKNLGATFTIDLPRTKDVVKSESSRSPDTACPVHPLRILVVEDDEATAQVLCRVLRSSGHDVSITHSAGDALRAAGERSFDLVLSDIGLPDATGWDMMRQMQLIRPIRGIAISGFVSEEDSQKSLEAGFLCHLRKPISVQQLTLKLAQCSPATTAV